MGAAFSGKKKYFFSLILSCGSQWERLSQSVRSHRHCSCCRVVPTWRDLLLKTPKDNLAVDYVLALSSCTDDNHTHNTMAVSARGHSHSWHGYWYKQRALVAAGVSSAGRLPLEHLDSKSEFSGIIQKKEPFFLSGHANSLELVLISIIETVILKKKKKKR